MNRFSRIPAWPGSDDAQAQALLSDESDAENAQEPRWLTSRAPRQVWTIRQTLWRHLYNLLVFLKPSFLASSTSAPASSRPPTPSSTQYLDGIRGVASLFVFTSHWLHWGPEGKGWGYGGSYHVLQLPFVNLFYAGAAMVAVFFVISGFVLTHRSIQQMHRRAYADVYSGLTSSTFRRAVRLYVPAIVAGLVAWVMARLGLVVLPPPPPIPGQPAKGPPQHSAAELFGYLDYETDVWTWELPMGGIYNPQSWTITVQYRASLVIFVTVLGLTRTSTPVRLAVEAAITIHSTVHQRWDVAQFMAGMMLAEVEVLVRQFQRRQRSLDENKEHTASDMGLGSGSVGTTASRHWSNSLVVRLTVKAGLWLALVVGMFLASYPRIPNTEGPLFAWALHVWPFSQYRRRVWLGVGTVLATSAAVFLEPVQRPFRSRPALYLGRISYALYLVHILCLYVYGVPLRRYFEAIAASNIDATASGARGWAIIFSSPIVYPVTIWVADVFYRAVEVPSTTLARALERKCMASETA
ncbi:acyltransferase family protein [Microdochium nivale]|nr:acyltransferase family protein [Microdochium nivale]